MATVMTLILCACAAGNHEKREGRISQQLSMLRESKSYDLLEQNLLQLDEEYRKKENLLGQLFTTLDLADFYTYGFINFSKALSYLDAAERLNEMLGTSTGSGGAYLYKSREQEFFVTQGAYTSLRRYNLQDTKLHILRKKSLITSILEGKSPELAAVKEKQPVFRFETSRTGALIDAVTSSDQGVPVKYFDDFKKELTRVIQGYFDSRRRITQEDKQFYTHFNIAKVLIKTFDLNRLSEIQAGKVLTHIDFAMESRSAIESKMPLAYIYFMQSLCLARLGRSDAAVTALELMERIVDEINLKIREKEQRHKAERTEAITKGVLGMTAIVASSLVGVGIASNVLGTAGQTFLTGFVNDMDVIWRKDSFVGESEYSRELNVLLNMDEQLRLFVAVGDAYHLKGNTEKSIFFNIEAAGIINTLRSTISTEEHRISFAAYKDRVYNHLIEDLISAGRQAEAFRYSEAARSRALVDLLGTRADLKFKSEKQNELANRVRSFQISRDYSRLETNPSDDQARYINTLYDSEIHKERGITLVSTQSGKESGATEQMPDLEQLQIKKLLTVEQLGEEDLRKLLPKKSALVEYYISDKSVFAWVLTAHNLTLQKLPDSSDQLRQMVHDFRQNLKSGVGTYLPTAKALYTALFEPIEALLGVDRIYVVNHRFLHQLPIEALHDGRQFLVERYLFAYLPSGAMLAYLGPIQKPLESILILASPDNQRFDFLPPLEGAKQEAKDIKGYFPISRSLTGQNATESAVKELAIDFEAIHIASHGIFNANNPLQSCLYLSGDARNEGMLTAAELYGIRMGPGLITLSACESGLSSVENGDELIGLLRGLFFAGKSNIVASLWKVDDMGTRFLMNRFYANLQGKDKVDVMGALSKAKIESVQHPEYAHPYYWSAFNVYGLGM
ncbi:MAG: CHAT domain-containing protein [Proteobacteria bacterium]|nr:CHAT domain-containing protein [Pseudomonadota bacterium]MBU1570317.1 CHAT domain-containing protein [Pseudomonadota bacterium]